MTYCMFLILFCRLIVRSHISYIWISKTIYFFHIRGLKHEFPEKLSKCQVENDKDPRRSLILKSLVEDGRKKKSTSMVIQLNIILKFQECQTKTPKFKDQTFHKAKPKIHLPYNLSVMEDPEGKHKEHLCYVREKLKTLGMRIYCSISIFPNIVSTKPL